MPAAANGRTKSTLAALTRVWIDRNRPARRAETNAVPSRLTSVHAALPTIAMIIGEAELKKMR